MPSSDTSMVLPSPLGKIRHITKEKSEACAVLLRSSWLSYRYIHSQVCQLRNVLPKELVVPSAKLHLLDAFASGSFGQVFRAEYNGVIVAVKRYRVRE